MTKIHNLDNMPENYVDDPFFETGMQTKKPADLGGSEKIYVNIDYVKPGEKSAKYHSHSVQEEFFLILKGVGLLRLEDKTIAVKQGDFFSKPAGKNIAHQLINNGDEILEILDCGTVDENDIVTYPDENVIVIKKTRTAFKNSQALEDWSSDPD